MRAFALTCEALAHLDSVEAKVQCAAAHLIARRGDEIDIAARFFSGTPLPPGTPPPNIGAASIATVVAERCGVPASAVRRRAVSMGDLGTAVAALLDVAGCLGGEGLSLSEAAARIADLGPHSPDARLRLLRQLFDRVDALEAKYLTKLLVGSMRTGMQAGRVEEVIALAFRLPLPRVRRAHMLLGDIGLVASRVAAGRADDIKLRPFRPIRCMLAHTADDLDAVIEQVQPPFIVEPKFGGVRAQLHLRDGRHRVFSRSLEDMTHLFPEFGGAAQQLEGDWILDGEVLAWDDGPLPFEHLQQRLGRRQVPLTMLLDVPVVYQAFDVLQAAGEDLIDLPLRRRKEELARLPLAGPVHRLEHAVLADAAALSRYFEEALDSGREGLVVKDPDSAYHPGTRGREWLKLPRPLGSLSVVVTAAQYGRGKRTGWLSDMTFAVRDADGTLLDAGKVNSGLTDGELQTLTAHFKSTTTKRTSDTNVVEPTVVLEVTCSAIQRSKRYASGFSLRFPRIVRRRDDLTARDIDGLDRLEELFAGQTKRTSQR